MSQIGNTTETKQLIVSIAKPYGVETIYPENELARLFCRLLKQKTLTHANIKVIKELGYTVLTKETEL